MYVLSIGFAFISQVLISVRFQMVFTLIFIHNFLFVNIFIPKTRFYKYSTVGTLFSTILSYSILPSSFAAVFLEHCLCKILMYLLIPLDGSVFNISFTGNKFFIVYRTIWQYFNWPFFYPLTNFIRLYFQVSYNCTILNFLLVWRKNQNYSEILQNKNNKCLS